MKKYVWIVIVGLLIPAAIALFQSLKPGKGPQPADGAFLEKIQSWTKGRKCNAALTYRIETSCGVDENCRFVTAACVEHVVDGLDRVCKKSKAIEEQVASRVKEITVSFVPKRIQTLITSNIPNEKTYRMVEPFLSKGGETARLEGSTLRVSGWIETKGAAFKKARCKSAEEIQAYLETELALQ